MGSGRRSRQFARWAMAARPPPIHLCAGSQCAFWTHCLSAFWGRAVLFLGGQRGWFLFASLRQVPCQAIDLAAAKSQLALTYYKVCHI